MAKVKKLNLPPLIPHYLLCLLTEFEVCNLSYVTGFFHSDLCPSIRVWVINQEGKNKVHKLKVWTKETRSGRYLLNL